MNADRAVEQVAGLTGPEDRTRMKICGDLGVAVRTKGEGAFQAALRGVEVFSDVGALLMGWAPREGAPRAVTDVLDAAVETIPEREEAQRALR